MRKAALWNNAAFLYRKLAPKFPHNSDTAPVPQTLLIELTNRCNLRCVKCENRVADAPRGDMDFDLLERILDQAEKWNLPSVQFHFRGEPTLYGRLTEAVRAANVRGLCSSVVTNGVLVDEALWMELLKAGLSSICISIDAVEPDIRDKLQPGAGPGQLENLKMLKPVRDRMGATTTIHAHSVLTSTSRKKNKALALALLPHVDNISQVYAYSFGVLPPEEIRGEFIHRPKPRTRPCYHLWRTAQVAWDGAVNACCNDQRLLLKVGHVNEAPMQEIWNGAAYRRFRTLHLEKRFNEMPLCGNCTYEYDIHWRHFRDRFAISRMNRRR